MSKSINDVQEFWNLNPCGLPSGYSDQDKKSVFEQIERDRYLKQARIPYYADFASFKGKKVLEVGCGIGTDGSQFAKNGAVYTGVDLTEAGIRISRERFSIMGLKGEFVQINAEKLPFSNDSFDHVYSFGVIHHSEDPQKIVDEIRRVLKPGGTCTVMLYNRTSFYYLIEVQVMRKLFFKFCDKERLWKAVFPLFGKGLSQRFESFRIKLSKMKAVKRYPNELEWVSMNTDDVFCPIARVYSAGEAKRLFRDFRDFRTSVWFIDRENWLLWFSLVRFLPKPLINLLESRTGWFRMIQASKQR